MYDQTDEIEKECAREFSRLYTAGCLLTISRPANFRERVELYERYLRWFYSSPLEFQHEHASEIVVFNRSYIDKKTILRALESKRA